MKRSDSGKECRWASVWYEGILSRIKGSRHCKQSGQVTRMVSKNPRINRKKHTDSPRPEERDRRASLGAGVGLGEGSRFDDWE